MANLKFKSYIFISSNKSIFLHTFFYNSFFFILFHFFFFSNIQKCLIFYQLNIIKKIKKDYEKPRERYQNLSKE